MTTCCSSKCEKKYYCAKHCFNNVGTFHSEDFYSYGDHAEAVDGCVYEEYWCGELGEYKMFEPIKPTVTSIIQELDLGSDEELQECIDKYGYNGLITPEQIRNIIKERLHKLFKDSLKT